MEDSIGVLDAQPDWVSFEKPIGTRDSKNVLYRLRMKLK
jgi:hypothetical protein